MGWPGTDCSDHHDWRQSGAFVAVRGVLWKVARECLRDASPEEQLAETMIQRFLWGLRHARLGGDRGASGLEADVEPGELAIPARDADADVPPEPEGLSSESAAGATSGAASASAGVQHKRSETFEQGRQRKERKLDGHVKQEVHRIETQTRASEATIEEPPKQRAR
eukprot:388992-Amphidinium_carterae.1